MSRISNFHHHAQREILEVVDITKKNLNRVAERTAGWAGRQQMRSGCETRRGNCSYASLLRSSSPFIKPYLPSDTANHGQSNQFSGFLQCWPHDLLLAEPAFRIGSNSAGLLSVQHLQSSHTTCTDGQQTRRGARSLGQQCHEHTVSKCPFLLTRGLCKV